MGSSNTGSFECGGGAGKSLELTAYDRQRKCHKPVTDCTEIVISPRSLSSELCCPICLDLLTNTMTTKECLHRFCSECISTALQRGNKECPTCRKKLISRRALRPDPNFDSLINKLWPDRKEYEAIEERTREHFCRQSSQNALQKCIEAGLKAQAIHRRQRVQGSYIYEKRKRRAKDLTENDDHLQQLSHTSTVINGQSSNTNNEHQKQQEVEREIELILRPNPDLASLEHVAEYAKQNRYLKTTANATIDHLRKYLSMRIQMDGEDAGRINNNNNKNININNKNININNNNNNNKQFPEEAPNSNSIIPNNSPLSDFDCEISVSTTECENSGITLSGEMTLYQVIGVHWTHKQRPLHLEFGLANPPLLPKQKQPTNSESG